MIIGVPKEIKEQVTVRAARPVQLEIGIDEEIERVVAKGVTEDEVAKAKQQLQDRAILARDNLETAPRIIGSALMTGRDIPEFEAWPERIGQVLSSRRKPS